MGRFKKVGWVLVGVFAVVVSSVVAAPSAVASCQARQFVVTGFGGNGQNYFVTAPGYEAWVVEYPNFPWNLDFEGQVRHGVDELNFRVNDFYDHCGDGAAAIITGFSLGAIIAGNVLETQPWERNIQGVLFADARRFPSDQPGDPGGAEGNPAIAWAIPGVGFRGFVNPTVTLCKRPDGVCYGGDPGGWLGVHYAPGSYTLDPGLELGIHGWGNWKNVVY